jgi:PST family polysaccharide transporter
VVSLFAVKALDLILTLGLIPFLILRVGIINYGTYAFAMAIMLFFVNVLNYGFDLSSVRTLAINKDNPIKIRQLFNEVISVKLFLVIIIYTIIFAVFFFIPRLGEYKRLFLYASLILVGDLFSLRWFFLGLEKMKFITVINFFSTFTYVGMVMVLVKQKTDFILIPLAEATGMFLVSTISLLWVLKQFKIKIQLLSIKEIVNYLKLNFSSFINLLLPSTTGIFIVFLVGVFGLPYDVTLMQIGVKFTSAFSSVNTILTIVFYPMLNSNQRKMKMSRNVLFGVGFFLSIVMFFGSEFLISNWLKLANLSDLNNVIQLIKILSPIPFLMGVISSYGVNGLLIYFKDLSFSIITIISTLVMLVLASCLIPKFHFFGGAISFLVSRMLYAILLYLSCNRHSCKLKNVVVK